MTASPWAKRAGASLAMDDPRQVSSAITLGWMSPPRGSCNHQAPRWQPQPKKQRAELTLVDDAAPHLKHLPAGESNGTGEPGHQHQAYCEGKNQQVKAKNPGEQPKTAHGGWTATSRKPKERDIHLPEYPPDDLMYICPYCSSTMVS